MNGIRMIPPKIHGVTDYLAAILLLLAPNLFGFAELGGWPVWIARGVGVLILLQALMTDYEVGVFRVLPFRLHLLVDYIVGPFLAISPFLFGFFDNPANVWLPHLAAGLAATILTLLTRAWTDEELREGSTNPHAL